MDADIIQVVETVSTAKDVEQEVIFDAIESAIASATKKKYAEDEAYAKSNKLGIWMMKFEYPWVWRKKNK